MTAGLPKPEKTYPLVFGDWYVRYEPEEHQCRGLVSMVLRRKLDTKETIIVVDGQIYTSKTPDPTLEDIKTNPKMLLFVAKPTIEMWTEAIKEWPQCLKFAPIKSKEDTFINELHAKNSLTGKNLLHLAESLSRETVIGILERVPVTPEEFINLVDMFGCIPTIKAVELSMRKHAGFHCKEYPVKFYEAIDRLFQYFIDTPDCRAFIRICFDQSPHDLSANIKSILRSFLKVFSPNIGPKDVLLPRIATFVKKRKCYTWLYQVMDTLEKDTVAELIHILQQKDVLDPINIPFRYITLDTFKRTHLDTPAKKIAAIESICKDMHTPE